MSDDQKLHTLGLLDKGTRLDGRKPMELRKNITIEKKFTKTAEGSAKVIWGETEVLVGVKLELGKPYPDSPDEGTIMVGAELLPLSNPNFESGPPGIQAVELARIVDRGIRESGTLDFKKLCIEEGEKIWIVLIDIVTLNDAGNLIDAAALGAYAALTDAVYPKIEGDKVNYKDKTTNKLELAQMPVTVTVCKIGSHLILDPISAEEPMIDARLSVVSLENGELCALQKNGEMPLDPKEIEQMLQIGIDEGKKLRALLKK